MVAVTKTDGRDRAHTHTYKHRREASGVRWGELRYRKIGGLLLPSFHGRWCLMSHHTDTIGFTTDLQPTCDLSGLSLT